MIRRPPRSTQSRSSAASDVYKRQVVKLSPGLGVVYLLLRRRWRDAVVASVIGLVIAGVSWALDADLWRAWLDSVLGRTDMVGNSLLPVPYMARAAAGLCLLYTSDAADDLLCVDLGGRR